LLIDEFKHEDLENRPTINQVLLTTDQFSIMASYPPKDKLDEVLETETRGVDFKGNVRYFCPKCNVRYIGEYQIKKIIAIVLNLFFLDLEFKYLKTHLKECGNVHECQLCQQKFKQKRTFTAHMKKKHGIGSIGEKSTSFNSSDSKSFSFPVQSP
jgi:hypothetical protein